MTETRITMRADDVGRACHDTIKMIEAEREKMYQRCIDVLIKPRWWRRAKPLDEAREWAKKNARAPDFTLVSKMYREQERTCADLGSMAMYLVGASHDGTNTMMEVTLSDFSNMAKALYQNRKSQIETDAR